MAAASPNECSAANALVSEGRTFDAESSDLRRERHARPGPCRCRALGPPAVSASGLTTPTFRTVSLAALRGVRERKGSQGWPKLRRATMGGTLATIFDKAAQRTAKQWARHIRS